MLYSVKQHRFENLFSRVS